MSGVLRVPLIKFAILKSPEPAFRQADAGTNCPDLPFFRGGVRFANLEVMLFNFW